MVTIESKKDNFESDTSWSDEDLFKDDSFILQATQSVIVPNPISENRGIKRKIESNSEEMNSSSVNKQGRFQNVNTVNHNALTKPANSVVKNLYDQQSSSFRKHKSFNESAMHEKSGKNTLSQAKNRSNLRKSGSFSGSFVSSMERKTIVTCDSSQNSANLKNTTGNFYASRSKGSEMQNKDIGKHSLVKQHPSNKVETKSVIHVSNNSNFKNYRLSSSSNTQIIPKLNNSVVLSHINTNKSLNNQVPKLNQSPVSTVGNNRPSTSSRRRSSGMFDTSLSDDLLCQLAEPDDILDCDIPSKTNQKFSIMDDSSNLKVPSQTKALHSNPVAQTSNESLIKPSLRSNTNLGKPTQNQFVFKKTGFKCISQTMLNQSKSTASQEQIAGTCFTLYFV